MAEKQNCSDIRVNSSIARRRASLPTLSRILKSQSSSFQHRCQSECGPVKKKLFGGGYKLFLAKALVGCGAVYFSAWLGVWGEAKESTQIVKSIKRAISKVENENIISENMKIDFADKLNKSKEYVKGHLEAIPEELKAYYNKSEKYVTSLIQGKKD